MTRRPAMSSSSSRQLHSSPLTVRRKLAPARRGWSTQTVFSAALIWCRTADRQAQEPANDVLQALSQQQRRPMMLRCWRLALCSSSHSAVLPMLQHAVRTEKLMPSRRRNYVKVQRIAPRCFCHDVREYCI